MTERDLTADELPEYFAVLDALDKVDDICRRFGFPGPVDQLPAWLAKRFEQDAETYAAAVKTVDGLRADVRAAELERDTARAGYDECVLALKDASAQLGGLTAACERLKLELAEARAAGVEYTEMTDAQINDLGGRIERAEQQRDAAHAWRDRVVAAVRANGFPALDPAALPGWLHLHLQTLAGELRMAKLDAEGKRAELTAMQVEMRTLRETIAALKPHTNH